MKTTSKKALQNYNEMEIKRIFKIFSEGTQYINDRENLKSAVRCLGYIINDDERFDKVLDYIGFVEFISKLPESPLVYSDEELNEAFKILDPQESGYIKASDLMRILKSGDNFMGEEEIRSFFSFFPPNSQGNVCYDALIKSVNNK